MKPVSVPAKATQLIVARREPEIGLESRQHHRLVTATTTM